MSCAMPIYEDNWILDFVFLYNRIIPNECSEDFMELEKRIDVSASPVQKNKNRREYPSVGKCMPSALVGIF